MQLEMDCPEMRDLHLQIRRACHDLGAPLRAVRGFAEIIERRERENLSQRGLLYLERLVAATGHMEQVVSGLHRYARIASHTVVRHPLALTRQCDRILGRHFAPALAAGHLCWQADRELHWHGDPELLEQIICALVDNGLRFTDDDRPDVSLHCQATDDGAIRIRVRDCGIGIAPEHQTRLFQLFERLHPRDRYPGAGVGLTIVWKATELLGGTIAIDSSEGAGTTIEVVLPQRNPTHR